VYLLPVFVLFVLLSFAGKASGEIPTEYDLKKQSLIQNLKEKGFSEEESNRLFSDERVVLYPEILEKKGKGLNYMSKRFGLLSRKSIKRGQKVISDNKDFLDSIEKEYGVDKEVIVAIYRVETNLGQSRGGYLVFNSLLTRVLIENRRSEWAERELINLLLLCKSKGLDPLTLKGSWAGAFGLCQFIPSSAMTHAVDGNKDGDVDLFNFHDAMASIANYLKANGWDKKDTEKKKKAIWSYNHCDNYVKAVLAYARASKKSR